MKKESYLEIRKMLGLQQQSWRFYFHVLQDVVLVGLMLGLWGGFPNSILRMTVSPVLAVFMYRKFALLHEAVHGAIFKSRFWNDVVGILASPFCFLPYEPWRASHMEHHFWSGNIEKDPVMAILVVYPKLSQRVKGVFNFFWRAGLPILGFCQHLVFLMISFKAFMKNPRSIKIGLSLLWPLLVWGATAALCTTDFLFLVIAPTLLFYLMGVEVLNLPHHLQMTHHRGETRFALWNQHGTARSCIYPKWIAHFAVLNFNYHIEHHMFPDAPWYYLDRLHEILSPMLKEGYQSDLNFSWILRAKRQPLEMVLTSIEAPSRVDLIAS